jgi:6-phosphogluconolactonase (cycloisomerase 2 family)
VTSPGDSPHSVAVEPSGRFAYVSNSDGTVTTYSIGPSSGALTQVGSEAPGDGQGYVVTVDPTGRFVYVGNAASNTITTFSIDPTTGTLTEVGTEVPHADAYALAVDPSGRFLYASGGTRVTAYSIDQSTGALTLLDPDTDMSTDGLVNSIAILGVLQ